MTLLAMAGMTVAALAAVGGPLVASGSRRRGGAEPAAAGALMDRKDALYRDIQDLELDRLTGKVALDDYEAMREQYESEAATVLEAMERRSERCHAGSCPTCGCTPPKEARFCPDCGDSLDRQAKVPMIEVGPLGDPQ